MSKMDIEQIVITEKIGLILKAVNAGVYQSKGELEVALQVIGDITRTVQAPNPTLSMEREISPSDYPHLKR